MSYSVESVNGCTKKIVFKFDTLDLTTEIKSAVAKKQKTVNLKGFRKGKAPLAMVEQIYGPQLESEALNSFVQGQFFDAVEKENLRVVGYPKFENINYESGKSVHFDAVVEIFPEIELKDVSSLSFKRDDITVTDDDVENLTKNYLNSKAEMIAIEDDSVSLDKGHFAVLNFQGEKEDGERPANMKGEEYVLEIGSGQFIPGFEEGMVGMKAGEKKDVNLTFPEDYHQEELKNAKVKFEVELLEIKEKKYPELNDELAKEFGFESVEDFKTKNRENLEAQKVKAADEKLHQEILEKLIEENQFDVPMALIAQQEVYVKQDLERTLAQQGFDEGMKSEYFKRWQSDISERASFQVRSGLILDTLATKYGIEVGDADFNEKLEETSKASGLDIDQIKKYYESDPKIKQNMMHVLREEKTFNKLKSEMKIA